jgi:membrane protein
VKTFIALIRDAAYAWSEDKAYQMGAAMAYYAVFSIAPLLVLTISVAGMVYGEEAARGQIVNELKDIFGPVVAQAIENTLSSAYRAQSGTLATVVGVAMLLFGATGLFSQIQDALDTIWKVKPKEGRGYLDIVKDRALSYLMVMIIGALLFGSVVVHTAIDALAESLPRGPIAVKTHWTWLNPLLNFGGITVAGALAYKILPDAKIAWLDVLGGAVLTAVLFVSGNAAISYYLRQSGVVSAYGAAGSLIVILLWVYYSSQIMLFGAEVTQVWARYRGRIVEPKANAERRK